MEKELYIKTEPGGTIAFGKMSEHDIDIFNKSKSNKMLSKDILFKVKRGVAPYKLINGVANSGNSGELGNEGIIELAQDKLAIPFDNSNKRQAGIYIAYLSLSKVSIQFKISTKSAEKYDAKKLVEKSVAVDLPDCVKHCRYSDLKFNIVTDYWYDGKIIKNANKEMINRGFEESISIFLVENNSTELLYELNDFDETFF